MAGLDQFPVFDRTVRRRGRAWRWSVSTSDGGIVMCGSEGRRSAAAYQANRAIFLLLSAAPYQLNGFVRHSADGHWPKNCGVDLRGPIRRGQRAENKGREGGTGHYMAPLI